MWIPLNALIDKTKHFTEIFFVFINVYDNITEMIGMNTRRKKNTHISNSKIKLNNLFLTYKYLSCNIYEGTEQIERIYIGGIGFENEF